MANQPLQGIRILSMEQVVALPFATRHLADLGAEVIRVQSHKRFTGAGAVGSLFRNKSLLGLDLAAPHGPEIFLKLAAACDVVAHNFTPCVMRKYGIDYDGVKAHNERIIYCSVTGYGTTGPWRDRPLFGPGAEALSGLNVMIGHPDALTPGSG
jgi:crotonobetainyl-CoA:carnitine CoA-transferase CaiB-like acyl-CoA transferase